MKTTTKRPVKKAETKKVSKNNNIETNEVKETKSKTKMMSELNKIAEAYSKAINGEIKFRKVKEMFIRLHKDLKRKNK